MDTGNFAPFQGAHFYPGGLVGRSVTEESSGIPPAIQDTELKERIQELHTVLAWDPQKQSLSWVFELVVYWGRTLRRKKTGSRIEERTKLGKDEASAGDQHQPDPMGSPSV